MNIVVTINRNYIRPLCVMLRSLIDTNTKRFVNVYLMHTELTAEDISYIEGVLGEGNYAIRPVVVGRDLLSDAPVNFHFSREMYFRIFAASLLPQDLDRALYLDPDMVILKDLSPLYDMDMGQNFFAAAYSINNVSEAAWKIRLHMPLDSRYFNSGVLLMNLPLLRREQDEQEVIDYIAQNSAKLMLPDQDTLNALYHARTALVNPMQYNLDMRYANVISAAKLKKFDEEAIRRGTTIVHYCGKHKPWHEDYRSPQGVFYWEAEKRTFQSTTGK